jgi:hypothetical protein
VCAVYPPLREEQPLNIALEVEMRMCMPVTAIPEPGGDSNGTVTKASRMGPLTNDEIPVARTCRDPYSPKSLCSLPWEGDE